MSRQKSHEASSGKSVLVSFGHMPDGFNLHVKRRGHGHRRHRRVLQYGHLAARNIIPDKVRIPCISSYHDCHIVQMIVEPSLVHLRDAGHLPLIVVNCIIWGAPVRQQTLFNPLDSVGMGIGFTLTLLVGTPSARSSATAHGSACRFPFSQPTTFPF